jgi:hypothetical protein
MSQAACNELNKMSWFKPFYGNLMTAARNATLTVSSDGELSLGVSRKSLASLMSKTLLDKVEALVMDHVGPGLGKNLVFSQGALAMLEALEVLADLRKREENIRLGSRNDRATQEARFRKKLAMLMAVMASDRSHPVMSRFRNKNAGAIWLWDNYWRYDELLDQCHGNQPRTQPTIGPAPANAR